VGGQNMSQTNLRWRKAAIFKQETLALASMARDEPHASSTASSMAAAMRGTVGSEFET